MEPQNIKNDIKEYIESSKKYDTQRNNLDIELIKIGGYSNFNYKVIIKDTSSNKPLETIFYRRYSNRFSALSDSVDHEKESTITKLLSEKGYGPKILYEVKNNFIITEFLEETTSIPIEKYFDKNLMEQLCSILNYFNDISYTYKYHINNNNEIILNQIIEEDKNKIDIANTQYKKTTEDLYEKAKKNFDIFLNKFIDKKYSKEIKLKEFEQLELIKDYIHNFKKIYNENFPLKGFLVLNHNDVFGSNILYKEKESKIYLIDHEYFSLNLPGQDIAYYITEYFIQYEPEYCFNSANINYEHLFKFMKSLFRNLLNLINLLKMKNMERNLSKRFKLKSILLN